MLEIKILPQGGNKVIELVGELDIANVDDFEKSVQDASMALNGSITMDMAKLVFVDSTGVGGLLKVIKGLRNNSIEVKISNVNPDVYEVFDLLGLPLLLGNEIFQ